MDVVDTAPKRPDEGVAEVVESDPKILLLCEAGLTAPDPNKPPEDVVFAGTVPKRPELPLVDVLAKDKVGADLGGSDIVYTQTSGSRSLMKVWFIRTR